MYCRYEGKHRQRHLAEQPGLNMDGRMNSAMRGERWGELQREGRGRKEDKWLKSGAEGQEAKRARSQWLAVIRKRRCWRVREVRAVPGGEKC